MPALKNAKHEAVLQAFLTSGDRVGWRAYKAVYKKSSQRAAETAWSRLLKSAEFKARFDELTAEVTERAVAGAVMDLQEVLAELSKLGRSNLQHMVVRGDNTAEVVESLQALPPEHAAAIQELTIETYVEGAGDNARDVKRVKVKLHSKPQALSELRRHHEPNRHEHAGAGGGPIKTEDVTPISDLDAARRVAFLLRSAARAPKKKG